jgi:hypothetical protein
MLNKNGAITLAREHFLEFLSQREEALVADAWIRGENARPSRPLDPTKEYKELEDRSPTPWLGLVVTAVAQSLYVEGHRPKTGRDDSKVWKKLWQPNGMDARQIAVHRGALGHGVAFGKSKAGESQLDGSKMVTMRGVSAMRGAAFWQDPVIDEFPMFFLEAEPELVSGDQGWRVWVTDEVAEYEMVTRDLRGQEDWTYITHERHSAGVTPVVRFANSPDLDGNTVSDITPFIPIASRIDQDTFDRLIVQRFGSWKVRYIAGMAKPNTEEAQRLQALALRVEDLLISENPDTKFGTLDATDLSGYIEARDADIRDLAAVSQTPPHHLLGMAPNVGVEGMVEAQAGLMRKVDERKHLFGEAWERWFRLGAHMLGMDEESKDFESQIWWKDTESRSLAQSADALGKLAQMLGVPYQMLWERIPGWTSKDTEDAVALLEEQRAELMLMQELGLGAADAGAAGAGSPPFPTADAQARTSPRPSGSGATG